VTNLEKHQRKGEQGQNPESCLKKKQKTRSEARWSRPTPSKEKKGKIAATLQIAKLGHLRRVKEVVVLFFAGD